MFKKIVISLLLVIMILPVVSAFDIFVNPTEQDSHKIYFDEIAKYTVTITNTDDYERIYALNINPVEWVLETSGSVKVPAGETKSFPLNFKPKPTNFKGPGTYYVPLSVRSNTDETETTQLPLYIRSFNTAYGSYLPTISIGSSIAASVDPREKVKVQIVLRNRNILDIKDLEVIVNGGIFQGTHYENLSGLAEKVVEYSFDVDPKSAPVQQNLKVTTKFNGKVLSEINELFEVTAYSVIDRETTQESNWFKTTKFSTLTNKGNIEKQVDVKLDTPWYVRLFTGVEIESENVEKVKSTWLVTLAPYESVDVTIVENYRYLVSALVLGIVILVLYFVYRSPIVIKKQIIVTGKDEEGISEMRVRVFVVNRTAKAFYNLRLIDKAPSIATVLQNNQIGVLQATKIIPTDKKGTIVKWDVESIDAYEERIFTYTLKARLKIIGNLSLPSAKAKFENANGEERNVSSSKAYIGTKA
ncbi:MAG: hypothetical protein AB7V77_04740 [Candidatus Woesearchaeota archaeon]